MKEIELIQNKDVKALFTDKDESFKSVEQKHFSSLLQKDDFPIENGVLWLKFKVINTNAESNSYYLYNWTAYCDVFQETDTGWIQIKGGFLRPFYRRTSKEKSEFISFQLKPNHSTQMYVKLQVGNLSNSYTYPVIGDKLFYYKQLEEQHEYKHPASIFSLIYFSGILIIFLFTLITYITIRERVYLYYLLYLFFQLIYSLVISSYGTIGYISIAHYYPPIKAIANESVQFVFIGFYIFFILHLLQINKKRILGQFMNKFAWFCFGYAALSIGFNIFFPSIEGEGFLFILARSIALPINLLLIIWIIARVRHRLIPYFLFANIFFFLGSIISVAVSLLGLNHDPSSVFHFANSLNTIFQMGLLGEVICFSSALAHRVRLLQDEKEMSAQNYIHQLQENEKMQDEMNIELDKQIKFKTKELTQVYSDIEKRREKELKNEFSQKLNKMEMMALRSQMNPHFLFNSMNAIKYLILTYRSEDAMHYLDEFSILLRNVLQNSNKESITVESELEVLKRYLSLERHRLGDEFQFEIEVDDEAVLSQYNIPGLILQPIAENAIWHGLRPSNKKSKRLDIKFKMGDSLIISIQDNGIGRKASQKMKDDQNEDYHSMGLPITQERIDLFNQSNEQKINLTIKDVERKGKSLGTLVIFTYTI